MARVVGELETVIMAVAAYTGLDYQTLLDYANADHHTGWDFDKGQWPCGSLHRPEGQILYALTRALEAEPLEFGSHHGCSATHLAQAVLDSDLPYQVTSIDTNGMNRDRIPANLQPIIKAIGGDGHVFVQSVPDASRRLIFEDTGHGREGTAQFWRESLPKLTPGGIMVSHDPESELVGANIVGGVEDAGIHDYLIVRTPPSDCGLILYRKPGELPNDKAVKEAVEVLAEIIPEQPKRKVKRHATAANG